MAFARCQWEETPRDLGIIHSVQKSVKKLQIFGPQLDELWSFVSKKKKRRWIWVAYGPVHHLVIAHHIGGRGK